MEDTMVLYHGSQQIVKEPRPGVGKKYNDYGQGFYCTESIELAKEWACPVKNDGYANQYLLHKEGLKFMYLTRGQYNILNWMAILLQNRTFDISSAVANGARAYLLENFLPDLRDVDVIVGYRADDSYFSFAEDFVNNTISLRILNRAMQLGNLGEQIVLISTRAFENIEYIGSDAADYREYYYKRSKRDKDARAEYRRCREDLTFLKQDYYVLDIIREEMRQDDPRLRFHLSE